MIARLRPQGYAIPLSLCVAGVTLMLGLSAAQMTAGDLALSNRQYYQERARQVAEYGLHRRLVNPPPAITDTTTYALGEGLAANQAADLTQDSASVRCYDNSLGNLPSDSGCPVEVPVGFQYWVSEGTCSHNGQKLGSVRLGAIVRNGVPAGAAGAQIRRLKVVSSANVSYSSLDAVTGTHSNDENICSTPSLSQDALGHPLTFGTTIGSFAGRIQVAPAASDNVHDQGSTGPRLERNGGQFNIPEYTSPLNGAYTPSRQLTTDTSLPPGRYGVLEIAGAGQVDLNGDYYFERLVLRSGTRLRVAAEHTARVHVDTWVEQGGPQVVGLTNFNSSARNFRILVKPQPEPPAGMAVPAGIHVRAENGGRFSLQAPGACINVTTDPTGVVRGSIACDTLELDYGNAGPARSFVYDVSASLARSTRVGGPGPGNGSSGGTGGTTGNTNGSTTGDTSGGTTGDSVAPQPPTTGGDGGGGGEGEPPTQPVTVRKRSQFEAAILSVQTL